MLLSSNAPNLHVKVRLSFVFRVTARAASVVYFQIVCVVFTSLINDSF